MSVDPAKPVSYESETRYVAKEATPHVGLGPRPQVSKVPVPVFLQNSKLSIQTDTARKPPQEYATGECSFTSTRNALSAPNHGNPSKIPVYLTQHFSDPSKLHKQLSDDSNFDPSANPAANPEWNREPLHYDDDDDGDDGAGAGEDDLVAKMMDRFSRVEITPKELNVYKHQAMSNSQAKLWRRNVLRLMENDDARVYRMRKELPEIYRLPEPMYVMESGLVIRIPEFGQLCDEDVRMGDVGRAKTPNGPARDKYRPSIVIRMNGGGTDLLCGSSSEPKGIFRDESFRLIDTNQERPHRESLETIEFTSNNRAKSLDSPIYFRYRFLESRDPNTTTFSIIGKVNKADIMKLAKTMGIPKAQVLRARPQTQNRFAKGRQ